MNTSSRVHPNTSVVRVVTACPAEIPDRDWVALAEMLDPAERRHSARFAYPTDCRAYILAHALRRWLIAAELGIAPFMLRFDEDKRGKPALVAPKELIHEQLFFSHSRSRIAVACAVTRLAPVGIDLEPIDASRADRGLLAPYAVRNDAASAADFFVRWTALEAFWKAWGTGLAHNNPRLCLEHQRQGLQVRFEHGEEEPCGVVLAPDPPPGCAIAVALRLPFTGEPVIRNMHCRSAHEMTQLGSALWCDEKLAAA